MENHNLPGTQVFLVNVSEDATTINVRKTNDNETTLQINLENAENETSVCRTCATNSDFVIPIFHGEGLQNNLADKIHQHLPIQVTATDSLPLVMCYQCASTLLAWHELDKCCRRADQLLREMCQQKQTTNQTENSTTYVKTEATQQPLKLDNQWESCPYCGVRTARGPPHRDHLLASHYDQFFHCAECDTYVDRKSLVIHMSLHALHYATSDDLSPPDGAAGDAVKKKSEETRTEDAERNSDSQSVNCSPSGETTRINVVINAQNNVLFDNIAHENQNNKSDMQQNLLVIKRVVPTPHRPDAAEEASLEDTKKRMIQKGADRSECGENESEHLCKLINRKSNDTTEKIYPEIIDPQEIQNVEQYYSDNNSRTTKEATVDIERSKLHTDRLQLGPLTKCESTEFELKLDFEKVFQEPTDQNMVENIMQQIETERNRLSIQSAIADSSPLEMERVVVDLLSSNEEIERSKDINETKENLPNNEQRSSEGDEFDTERSSREEKFLKDTKESDNKQLTSESKLKRFVEECLGIETVPKPQASRESASIEFVQSFPFVSEISRHSAEFFAAENKRQDVAHIVEQVVAERNRIADFDHIFSKQKNFEFGEDEFSDHGDIDCFDPLPESIFDAIDDAGDIRPEPKPETPARDEKPEKAPKTDGNHQKKGRPPRKCPICGKVYRVSSSYFYHMKHFHRGEKEHACETCGKRFGSRAALAHHRAVHSDRYHLQCDDCGKRFRSKMTLYIHLQNHRATKRFLCDSCPRAFKWKQQLTRHLRRHSEEKRHACPTCGKAFKVRYDLARHATTHAAGVHSCAHCGACFAQPRYLKAHMDKKHAPRGD